MRRGFRKIEHRNRMRNDSRLSVRRSGEYPDRQPNGFIKAALELQREGVNFVAADCGLFSLFQLEIGDGLTIPFILVRL